MTVRAFTIGELCVSPYNVRKDGRSIGALDALKRSIQKRGLLMPLVVHPMVGNPKKFGAIAGGRRYRALKALIADGLLPANIPIDAVVREGMTEAQLVELSAAENLVRRDLYPYETYAALARARRRGSTFEEIAESLGQDIDWVRKGARLGMLPEAIFKSYADEELSLECAKAFAATEDEKLQLHVFATFQQQPKHLRTPALVRQLLKVGDSELTRLLLFIGEELYRTKGGRFELDLFADADEVRGRVSDEGLLRDLAMAKLDDLRKRIRARAGRHDLRFAAEPPTNDFAQVDRSLQIHPPEAPLDPSDEARLAELEEDEARLVDRARQFVDAATGGPIPGSEAEIGALDVLLAPIEAEIDALEDKRPIVLPKGDVVATIDIDDTGAAIVRYWWESRKAQAAADKPAPKKAPGARPQPANAKGAVADLKPVADGAAVCRPGSGMDDWSARERADRIAKEGFGLTQEGVQVLRSLRRSLLRSLLIQDGDAGGSVASDYFTWGQLRMLLTKAGSETVGMRRFASLGPVEQREDNAGAELIDAVTIGHFEMALERLKGWLCFTLPDLQAAFLAYRALGDYDKDEAATLLTCLVLERSLEADGYRLRIHDLVATETGLAGAAQLRETAAFTPTAPFFNLFGKDHKLELARPFVSPTALLVAAKSRTAEQNAFAEKVFTGTSPELLDGIEDAATRWVHPLLEFQQPPLQAPADAASAELVEAAE